MTPGEYVLADEPVLVDRPRTSIVLVNSGDRPVQVGSHYHFAAANPALLFDRLHALGLVMVHNSTENAQDAIARTARVGDAITVATNDEARDLNARIRDERVRTGLVDDAHTVTGSDGLLFGRGDVIQTRRNDADVQVANRQTWTVQDVEADGTVWATENGIDRIHQRTVRLPTEYVAEHTHLAYASTAYGVQGVTVAASHTVLGDALDAAGVYVGMTRGREANRLHIIAADLDDAREQFTAALERDRADRGLVVATQTARDAVTGLVADGPVKLANAERARLVKEIEHANEQAGKWQRSAAALDEQRREHQAEADEQRTLFTGVEVNAERIRTEVAAPLMTQAAGDGAAFLGVRERMWEASNSRPSRIQRQAADRTRAQAVREYDEQEATVRRRWGSTPTRSEAVQAWAETAVGRSIEDDPRVIDALQQIAQVRENVQGLHAQQMRERDALRMSIYGRTRTRGSAATRSDEWTKRAEEAHDLLAQIEALPIDQAAAFIREHAEAQRAVERAVAERAALIHESERDPRRTSEYRPPFGRGGRGL